MRILLSVTLLVVIVPFTPLYPRQGLDPSWIFSMNQAVAQGLIFGRDIIFSYGPYAAIVTKEYHPAVDFLIFYGSLFFGFNYSMVLLLLMPKKLKSLYVLLLILYLVGFVFSRDALFLAFPLLFSLLVYRMLLPQGHSEKIVLKPALQYCIFTSAFAVFGLLPLIKISFLLFSGISAVICSLLFFYQKNFLAAGLAISAPPCFSMLFWLATGQTALSFFSFFTEALPIVTGYSEAMALASKPGEIFFFLWAAGLLLYTIGKDDFAPQSHRLFLFASYGLFLFVAFKSGFVRHDGHAIKAGSSLILCGLSMIFKLQRVPAVKIFAILLALYSGFHIEGFYADNSIHNTHLRIFNTCENAWVGLNQRLTEPQVFQRRYEQVLERIRAQHDIAILSGSTDIYSFRQSELLATRNIWNPRPVFQSYSAYTRTLAEINERHLRSAEAPDNILFRLETIDNRFPSLDDGLSWPALLDNYAFNKLDRGLIYLKKRDILHKTSSYRLLIEKPYKMGETVALPESTFPVFAEIQVRPTFLGRLCGLFYKPSELKIKLNMQNGDIKEYRVISSMMASGFFISPLIDNTTAFAALVADDKSLIVSQKVKSFSLINPDDVFLYWNDDIKVALKAYLRK